MSDINLLPSQAKFQAKKMALKARINFFLWIFGGVWMIFLIVVLGVFFISQMILNQLNKKYESGLSQYKSLLGSMAITQQVKYQAKLVSKVLGERFEYGSSIEKVKSIFSENVQIKDIKVENQKQFVLTGSVLNGQYVSEIEEKIVEINNGELEGFLRAKLREIGVTANGWVFEMEVNLK